MTRPRLHMICNAHLDPVWQWRWEEGCAETLSTFRTAVDLLHEHGGLIFNHNEAVLYRWVERYDPGLFREIKELVARGRWFISGGWFLQPDVNLPGFESLVRHITEGRRYFRQRFGVEPRVAYNFDSFGHTAGLPQLLVRSGYRMYVHMRPQAAELELPSDLYRWRGVDGSEILALRIAVGLYHTEPDNIEERMAQATELATTLRRDVPVFWGLGDHGGGATREDLARIDAFAARETRVEVVHSTPDALYDALRGEGEAAPVVSGDLQRVFTGCYTSLSRIKRRCRESLGALVQGEALCAAAWWSCGAEYPAPRLGEAWRGHLFNDFHDILPGSCTEPAERDALDLYGRVSETVRRLRLGAAVSLRNGPAWRPAIPAVVLNSNPSCTKVPLEVECMLDYRPRLTGTWRLRVLTADGMELQSQEEQPESLLPFNGWRRKVCFLADLPGVGLRVLRLDATEGSSLQEAAEPSLLHAVDRQAALIDSIDAGGGRLVLAGSLLDPLVVRDDGDAWGAGCRRYREVVGRFEPCGPPRRIHSGPVRSVTESVFEFGRSRIVLHTLAYSGWPILEFRFRVHWSEERLRLKLAVPTVFTETRALCEVPGGCVERPADGEEHVHGRWVLLRGRVGGRETALGVVNGGQHGFDLLGGELRLSVLRSAAYCHERGFAIGASPLPKYMDQGVHEFRLLITAGDTEVVRSRLPGLADWLDAPPVVYSHLPASAHGAADTSGSVPPLRAGGSTEILRLDPATIRLAALKRSDDGEALVVRLQETIGTETEACLGIGVPRVDARVQMGAFELKTLRVERDGRWREVDLIDER